MDYRLKPIGKTCTVTGNELVPGSVCLSTLVEQDGRFVRLDFSEAGWNGPPEGAVGYWHCTVPQPEQNSRKLLDANALMGYFEQLCEDANPSQDKLRYVLSLLLLQKRRLKLQGSRQDGDAEYLELIGSQGQGPFEVRDCYLSEDEINQLQKDLNVHLATG